MLVSSHKIIYFLCPTFTILFINIHLLDPCYVLLASTNVSLVCAVDKHQCLLAMCCQQAPMSPCYVLSASTNVSLLYAESKHQHLPAMCCWQAPMSPWYVLSTSTNVSLLCPVVNYQNLLASCGCRQALRKQPSRDQEGSDGGTCCNVVYLKNLLAPFLHAYDFFMQTVKSIKQTWHTSVSGSVFEFVLLFKGQTTIIPPAVL